MSYHEPQYHILTHRGKVESKSPRHYSVSKKTSSMTVSEPLKPKIDYNNLYVDSNRLRIAEGIFKGKTTFRCPECSRGLMLTSTWKLSCGEHGTLTSIDKAIDLRKIGKDKATIKWAIEEYEKWLEEAKEGGFNTVTEYVASMKFDKKDSYKEYAMIGVGLEKYFLNKK